MSDPLEVAEAAALEAVAKALAGAVKVGTHHRGFLRTSYVNTFTGADGVEALLRLGFAPDALASISLGNALIKAGYVVHAKDPAAPFKPKEHSLYRLWLHGGSGPDGSRIVTPAQREAAMRENLRRRTSVATSVFGAFGGSGSSASSTVASTAIGLSTPARSNSVVSVSSAATSVGPPMSSTRSNLGGWFGRHRHSIAESPMPSGRSLAGASTDSVGPSISARTPMVSGGDAAAAATPVPRPPAGGAGSVVSALAAPAASAAAIQPMDAARQPATITADAGVLLGAAPPARRLTASFASSTAIEPRPLPTALRSSRDSQPADAATTLPASPAVALAASSSSGLPLPALPATPLPLLPASAATTPLSAAAYAPTTAARAAGGGARMPPTPDSLLLGSAIGVVGDTPAAHLPQPLLRTDGRAAAGISAAAAANRVEPALLAPTSSSLSSSQPSTAAATASAASVGDYADGFADGLAAAQARVQRSLQFSDDAALAAGRSPPSKSVAGYPAVAGAVESLSAAVASSPASAIAAGTADSARTPASQLAASPIVPPLRLHEAGASVSATPAGAAAQPISPLAVSGSSPPGAAATPAAASSVAQAAQQSPQLQQPSPIAAQAATSPTPPAVSAAAPQPPAVAALDPESVAAVAAMMQRMEGLEKVLQQQAAAVAAAAADSTAAAAAAAAAANAAAAAAAAAATAAPVPSPPHAAAPVKREPFLPPSGAKAGQASHGSDAGSGSGSGVDAAADSHALDDAGVHALPRAASSSFAAAAAASSPAPASPAARPLVAVGSSASMSLSTASASAPASAIASPHSLAAATTPFQELNSERSLADRLSSGRSKASQSRGSGSASARSTSGRSPLSGRSGMSAGALGESTPAAHYLRLAEEGEAEDESECAMGLRSHDSPRGQGSLSSPPQPTAQQRAFRQTATPPPGSKSRRGSDSSSGRQAELATGSRASAAVQSPAGSAQQRPTPLSARPLPATPMPMPASLGSVQSQQGTPAAARAAAASASRSSQAAGADSPRSSPDQRINSGLGRSPLAVSDLIAQSPATGRHTSPFAGRAATSPAAPADDMGDHDDASLHVSEVHSEAGAADHHDDGDDACSLASAAGDDSVTSEFADGDGTDAALDDAEGELDDADSVQLLRRRRAAAGATAANRSPAAHAAHENGAGEDEDHTRAVLAAAAPAPPAASGRCTCVKRCARGTVRCMVPVVLFVASLALLVAVGALLTQVPL